MIALDLSINDKFHGRTLVDRNLAHLGLAKKAGLLAVGAEAVATAARRGAAHLIITASDASEGSVRRAKINAEANGVSYIAVPYTMFELGRTAGRGSPGTLAFLDKGLADGFIKRLDTAGEVKKKININEQQLKTERAKEVDA